MNKFGIMQGRFTNKDGFYPQNFPWNNWKEEFYLSKKIGMKCIEWMFNSEKYNENPIYNRARLKELQDIQIETDVCVESICANYFMQNSLCGSNKNERKKSVKVLEELLSIADTLNVKYIIIPLFEENSPQNSEEEALLAQEMVDVLKRSFNIKTELAIECEWNAKKIASFIQECNCSKVKVCYDLGNAEGLGYNVFEEISLLQDLIVNIHIKDKKQFGTSVLLGEGDVNFNKCFHLLRDIQYSGNYILETFFGNDAVQDTEKNYLYSKLIYEKSTK